MIPEPSPLTTTLGPLEYLALGEREVVEIVEFYLITFQIRKLRGAHRGKILAPKS